tara:strand:+ start:170 stop:1441 length:1272 start_codon:yes stop_codon:yes gene_type:complete
MATYVNDLRLKEISTGDESGTWGSSTNRNLELIAEGFARGTKDCFSSDADATETMADGSTDEIRKLYLKVTSSATLSATRTLTLAPNTISKVWIIENATTGSQAINISQGSGANVQIPNGEVKVVATDGAGSGAAVYDLFTDLNVAGSFKVSSDLTVGGDLTVSGDDITLATNTAGHLLIGDGNNYNPVALSNDATIASNGALTIADAAVSLDKLAANCINTSKILSGAVTNAEIGSGAAIDAAKIADGSVSSAEFQHLDGVTSAIQTQIDTKTTIAAVYPVGSIYINATNSTNPGTLLGFGTWVAFGSGKVPVGIDSSDTDFDTAEETGGAKTHTLTESELPAHRHFLFRNVTVGNIGDTTSTLSAAHHYDFAGEERYRIRKSSSTDAFLEPDITLSGQTGSGSAHNNVQPYIVVYMWKRTA